MAYEFRSLKLALRFYELVQGLRVSRRRLKEQLVSAAESAVLQLSEGDRRQSQQDRLCFFNRAFTSVKEAQMALCMAKIKDPLVVDLADHLGASVYKLTRWQP